MKIEINLDLSPAQKNVARWGVVTGVALGAIGLGIAFAAPIKTDWIVAGAQIKATSLSENLNGLQQQITALQNQVAGNRRLYAEQTANMTTAGDGIWQDVDGLNSGSFTVTAGTTIDIVARVDVTAKNLADPNVSTSTACKLRFVVDGKPGNLEAFAEVHSPWSGIPSLTSLIGIRRLNLDVGAHTVAVQLSKSTGVYANTACVAGGDTFGRNGTLKIDVNQPFSP